MTWINNPFADLYPTEKIKGDEFVGLFSSQLLNSATNLYRAGNTILEGVQGSGKSMLLALLKPEIRLAYSNRGQDFPIPYAFSNFFSAGINLTQDGAKAFSNLRPGKNPRPWQSEISLYFADYTNYILVKDILKTLSKYQGKTSEQLFGLNIDASQEKLDLFARKISRLDCWFDYMRFVNDYESFVNRIDDRLKEYRFLLSLNKEHPSKEMSESKTEIAMPVFEVASVLKDVGILEENTEVILYIDQYEELDHMCRDDTDILSDFRRVINKALQYRDDRVSFKIGTRGYAWKHNIDVFGSYVKLEEGRDFHIINIYELLRKRESTGNALYRSLCEEVFYKRIRRSGVDIPVGSGDVLSYVFGKSDFPKDKAKIYAGKKPDKTLKLDKSWPEPWVSFLMELVKDDPLSAHLGAAWCRQKNKGEIIFDIPTDQPPWEHDNKKWWKKERLQQSLVQMASNKGESLLFYGEDELIGVSGANILAFLTICQKIWSIYISTSTKSQIDMEELPPNINRNIQSAGIKEASRNWFEKIYELPGGNERKDFVEKLGVHIFKKYISDISMSNPGHTGISVPSEQLNSGIGISRLLDDCVDYSVLDRKDHTTKLSDKKPRLKYYIEPILCPYFKLPYQQTKEPIYMSCADLEKVTSTYKVEHSLQLGLDI